jgi:hypothetical protein
MVPFALLIDGMVAQFEWLSEDPLFVFKVRLCLFEFMGSDGLYN